MLIGAKNVQVHIISMNLQVVELWKHLGHLAQLRHLSGTNILPETLQKFALSRNFGMQIYNTI